MIDRDLTDRTPTPHARVAHRDSATGLVGIAPLVVRRRGREWRYYRVRCKVGQGRRGLCERPCAQRTFPYTPDGLTAAIAWRDAHWRTVHPGAQYTPTSDQAA